MTQAKHTPGPWFYDGEHVRAQTKYDGEVSVAVVRGWESKFREEEKANARLIAASPRMLEAMEAALWMVERMEGINDVNDAVIDEYRAAIAEAKGESQ